MKTADDDLQFLKPVLWDVDLGSIDLARHRKFIIERVLKFGVPADVCWLLSMYSSSEIIEVVKTSRNLDRKTANFWAVHFAIPFEEVRCLNMPSPQSCFP